ncbi:MAG: SUMF1/EgtB/PvdO family nonheme iron enzyme [Sedimentisphaerales bacterium]|nr:SUMF1/EgtB/PvdO family nonheme iron enzyme [Sedimentisphaerales bacterium]
MTIAKNKQYQKVILLYIIVAMPCIFYVGKAALAIEQIDQSNLPAWAGGWTNINPNAEGQAVMWQTFTPACSNLMAVEIDILTISPGQGDDMLTIEIAKDGDILAAADCSVEDGFDGLLRFEFPEAVTLIPEQIYELMVRDTGALRFGWKYASNNYERGSRYVGAQERPGTDWLFQTCSDAKYSGGTGEPNDPYRIATAEDLITLGETPEDYDKHFILIADIDLDPNLPGRKVFDRAVIAPVDVNDWENSPLFTGVFDGNGHIILHLSIEGQDFLGLFGSMGTASVVAYLGLEAADVNGIGTYVGSIAGQNSGGWITGCHSNGMIAGRGFYRCKGSGTLGDDGYMHYMEWTEGDVGGLVGYNDGMIIASYTSGYVNGHTNVGGLVGRNEGLIANSYSMCSVSGTDGVGGFIGSNGGYDWEGSPVGGRIVNCYSTGSPSGMGQVGGFVGASVSFALGRIVNSFWDTQTSGVTYMCGSREIEFELFGFEFTSCDDSFGRTTDEMQTADTFLDAGWDFIGETINGPNDVWKIWDGYDYPRLAWEPGPNTPLVFVDINDPNFYGQMSKYEVTNAQYCDFLNEALASSDITINDTIVEGANGLNSGEDYAGLSYYKFDGLGWTGAGATNGGAARIHYNEGSFIVDSGFGNHPVTYVSWYGATAFANYYGYYLPTEEQWQAVADYDGTYIYGCGQTIDPNIANYRDSENPDGTTSVGSYGLYGYDMSDMAGNVWEWTSSSLDSNRIFRGGSWSSYDSDCDVSIRGDGIPYANYYDIGFRVCR